MCTLAASFATGQVIKLADGKKYNYGEGGYGFTARTEVVK